MTCEQCIESIGPYFDGELSAEERAQVEEHLRDCPECTAAHRQLTETSSRLRAGLVRYEAPDVLRARIRSSLGEPARDAGPRLVPLASRSRLAWTRTIAAAAVVAVLSSGLTFVTMRGRAPASSLQQEVLSSHIRSLMPGHLTDVESNDQHNVKPWFNGRVNASPDVPRLDSLGFPLVGGRLDYIDGHNVATVVYTRRQHVINVFSWPAAGDDLAPVASSANGYHFIRSRRNGMESWIVSDLNPAELESFSRMLAR
ncbi:MAG TPA: anti-sigma factor [Gemmatimonadaceae bacterium]|jgi:anti-sigma factor RsiW